MAIAAIETRYAGCRFRSRLEARWAVFFDHLGIRWEYEPEGYHVGPENDRRLYLPDFYLPDSGLWVEVKGNLTVTDQRVLFYATIPGYGLPGVERGMLMLGDVPRVVSGWTCWHHVLRRCEKDLHSAAPGVCTVIAWFDAAAQLIVDYDYPGVHIADPDRPNPSGWAFHSFVMDEAALPIWAIAPDIAAAYTAARSARFEHGEGG